LQNRQEAAIEDAIDGTYATGLGLYSPLPALFAVSLGYRKDTSDEEDEEDVKEEDPLLPPSQSSPPSPPQQTKSFGNKLRSVGKRIKQFLH